MADNKQRSPTTALFRGWATSKKTAKEDPEVQKLEKQVQETRAKIQELREHGRIRRLHRLQALDALETRRLTLTEILRRMDKELQDKDVYEYGDILAEAFGERKIYAHRAIGLESLLCQFMHQMLAKQHQLKIIKQTAKDIQSLYQKCRLQNKDECHAFESMAVQVEASRLSMEAIYDDIFASQHALLAQFHHVQAGGTMTNYKIVKPETTTTKKQPVLTVSVKHKVSDADRAAAMSAAHHHFGGESAEDHHLVNDILSSSHNDDYSDGNDEKKDAELRKSRSSPNDEPSTSPSTSPKPRMVKVGPSGPAQKSFTENNTDFGATQSPTASGQQKSARERRREIEQLRKAGVVGRTSTSFMGSSSSHLLVDDEEPGSIRERVRELEARRSSITRSPSNTDLKERPQKPKVPSMVQGDNNSRSPIPPDSGHSSGRSSLSQDSGHSSIRSPISKNSGDRPNRALSTPIVSGTNIKDSGFSNSTRSPISNTSAHRPNRVSSVPSVSASGVVKDNSFKTSIQKYNARGRISRSPPPPSAFKASANDSVASVDSASLTSLEEEERRKRRDQRRKERETIWNSNI